MDFVGGGTVENAIRNGELDSEQCLRVAIDICKGMEHLAENGIIHRDLALR